MAAQAKHRDGILAAAITLFRRRGYTGTGLAELIAESGAPKGSVYHYFPAGKAAIGAAAVSQAGAMVADGLCTLADAARDPVEMVRRYAAGLAAELERTGWEGGCPIATVLLETAPRDAGITAAGDAALAAWAAQIERAAIAGGIPTDRARRLGSVAIAAFEGGMLQSRVARSRQPLIDVGEELAALFAGAKA